MIIDCGSFHLRPLTPADAGSMAAYANNYNIWRNVRDYFPHPYKLEDAVSFILSNEGITPPINLCIEYEGACAGVIGFIPQEDVYSKTADLGYWLGEPFWGKGIMTAAVHKTVEYIFSQFDVVRIHAGIFDWNGASMRVLEKAGFRKECVFEQSVYKDGQLINEHRYSILKRDWRA
jgi:[ribosomal protein S5]-alanine N-acetyltransferase